MDPPCANIIIYPYPADTSPNSPNNFIIGSVYAKLDAVRAAIRPNSRRNCVNEHGEVSLTLRQHPRDVLATRPPEPVYAGSQRKPRAVTGRWGGTVPARPPLPQTDPRLQGSSTRAESDTVVPMHRGSRHAPYPSSGEPLPPQTRVRSAGGRDGLRENVVMQAVDQVQSTTRCKRQIEPCLGAHPENLCGTGGC
jgi:hypothetical protein